jgi:hypothetical protein
VAQGHALRVGQAILSPASFFKTLVGRPVSLKFLKPSLSLRAHLAHPRCRSVLEFRMIFVFPRPCRLGQRLALAAELDFKLFLLGQETWRILRHIS